MVIGERIGVEISVNVADWGGGGVIQVLIFDGSLAAKGSEKIRLNIQDSTLLERH